MPLQIASYLTTAGRPVSITCDALHHDPETGIVTFYRDGLPLSSVDITTVQDADIRVTLAEAPQCPDELKKAHGLLGLAQLNAAFNAVVNKATAPRGVAPYRNFNTGGR